MASWCFRRRGYCAAEYSPMYKTLNDIAKMTGTVWSGTFQSWCKDESMCSLVPDDYNGLIAETTLERKVALRPVLYLCGRSLNRYAPINKTASLKTFCQLLKVISSAGTANIGIDAKRWRQRTPTRRSREPFPVLC